MNIEQRHNENIQKFIDNHEKGEPFGVSRMQRICYIGYNESCWTIEQGIEQGIFAKSDKKPWLYVIV